MVELDINDLVRIKENLITLSVVIKEKIEYYDNVRDYNNRFLLNRRNEEVNKQIELIEKLISNDYKIVNC